MEYARSSPCSFVMSMDGSGGKLRSKRTCMHFSFRRGGWYKIKPHLGVLPDTLDLIVIGGFFAQGTRRRELVRSLVFSLCLRTRVDTLLSICVHSSTCRYSHLSLSILLTGRQDEMRYVLFPVSLVQSFLLPSDF